jgi:hypothetical protein
MGQSPLPFHNQPSRFTAWRLLVLLGIVVATALWAVSNIKNSSRIDGPQGRGYTASRAGGFCFAPEQVGSGEKWPIMSPHIRIREGVERVTACPARHAEVDRRREQSRMGARRRPNANNPSPLATFVRRAEDCPPYQRFVGRCQAGIASGCSRRIIN